MPSQSSLQLPSLPPELWICIIRHLCQCSNAQAHDLAYLWTECRNISKLFRQEVDRTFIAKYLPTTRIQFNLPGKKHVVALHQSPNG